MKQSVTLYIDKTSDSNYQDVFHNNILANANAFEVDKSTGRNTFNGPTRTNI